MDMEYKGTVLHLIQIGTVMTDPEYRNQGLSRKLLETIFEEYDSKVDGYFLFANDTVLEFYPKFGFTKYDEYICKKEEVAVKNNGINTLIGADIQKIPVDSDENEKRMVRVLNEYRRQGVFNQIGNSDLSMYWLIHPMKDSVYYIPSLDVYAIAEVEKGTLILEEVFAQHDVSIDEVVQAFGSDGQRVILGFIPSDTNGYELELDKEEDTTLFMKGRIEDVLKGEKFKIPVMSHT